MEREHGAPIGTLALAITLAVGIVVLAPDAGAAAPPEQHVRQVSLR